MQQVTFLLHKNGTSVICDDAQASIFASWYNDCRKICEADFHSFAVLRVAQLHH